MAITVTIRTQAQENNANQAYTNEYSLKSLLFYLRDNSDDDYVKEVATIHANRIERKERRELERKQRIIEDIEDMILENMNYGDSATILSIQKFADEQQQARTNTYITGKNRNATRPKIETALKNLVEQGYLQESIERVIGYSNYVKVWTKIR